jgi:predicted PurR-regulated permease PerM
MSTHSTEAAAAAASSVSTEDSRAAEDGAPAQAASSASATSEEVGAGAVGKRMRARALGVGAQRALLLLAALATLAAIHIAAPVLLPALVGGFIALLLNPPVRALCQLGLPRAISAALVLGLLLGVLGLAVSTVYAPAMEAVAEAPRVVQRLQYKVKLMTRSLAEAGKVGEALDAIDSIGAEPKPRAIAVLADGSDGLSQRAGPLLATAASVGTATILVFLFLVFGELLFRRIVTIAPTLRDKRNTVEIVRSIQSDVSRYVGTITLVNVGLGFATGGVLRLLGVEDVLLWGLMATVVNFVPYVGPLVGAVLLSVVGLLQFDTPAAALLPALCYLGLNVIESQLVTPLVLGRHFALNPVVILLWLLFWGWLWGVAGLLLAMPMLVCAKIICARSESLRSWALIIER